MDAMLDLERYPLNRPDSPAFEELVASCRREMAENGMFNLDGLVRPAGLARAVREIRSLSDGAAYVHRRRHNVYFEESVPGLAPDHGALRRFDTINRTLCDDQLAGMLVHEIYEWAPLPAFLARVLDKPRLYLMRDPLARANVLTYRPGEALNWHFDRSLFTTTLLLQAADEGGKFEYRSNLRSDLNPNYDGVSELLNGTDRNIRVNPLAAGTLNVFAGKNTLHRVSPVGGQRDRVIAVYSYYEQPDVIFSDRERIGFYGRAGVPANFARDADRP
jgi:hypothetical protein